MRWAIKSYIFILLSPIFRDIPTVNKTVYLCRDILLTYNCHTVPTWNPCPRCILCTTCVLCLHLSINHDMACNGAFNASYSLLHQIGSLQKQHCRLIYAWSLYQIWELFLAVAWSRLWQDSARSFLVIKNDRCVRRTFNVIFCGSAVLILFLNAHLIWLQHSVMWSSSIVHFCMSDTARSYQCFSLNNPSGLSNTSNQYFPNNWIYLHTSSRLPIHSWDALCFYCSCDGNKFSLLLKALYAFFISSWDPSDSQLWRHVHCHCFRLYRPNLFIISIK